MTVAPDAAGGVLEFAAELRARTESRLAFRVAGKLAERPAEVGQRVRAGQVLARLDPADLKLGAEAAAAALRSAQSAYELAAAEFKRFEELRGQGFISALELERRQTTLKAQLAQLEQARANASVQSNLAGYAALTATAAGVITATEAEVGAVLAAGAPLLRLAHDGPRDAVFAVPEDSLQGLRALQGRRDAFRASTSRAGRSSTRRLTRYLMVVLMVLGVCRLLPARAGRRPAVHLPRHGRAGLLARRHGAADGRAGDRQDREDAAGGAARRQDPQLHQARRVAHDPAAEGLSPPGRCPRAGTRCARRSATCAALPQGVIGPVFNDDFGDVYGSIFALSGRRLQPRGTARVCRPRAPALLRVPDVAKVEPSARRPRRSSSRSRRSAWRSWAWT
jgi:pyruvate/2-oxoglutarate dehydrogenase complex dihydrolipoamide acyltransferase (E2) component